MTTPDKTADVLTQTAPERIWLQVNMDGDPEDRSEAYPSDAEAVTWCSPSFGGQEVEYVRADLAQGNTADSPQPVVWMVSDDVMQPYGGTGFIFAEPPDGEYASKKPLYTAPPPAPELVKELRNLEQAYRRSPGSYVADMCDELTAILARHAPIAI